jgi:hypothetical protein
MRPNVIFVDDIQSISPVIDARRSDKIFALSGSNFYFTPEGPRSFFGTSLVANFSQSNTDFNQMISLSWEKKIYSFLFTEAAVFLVCPKKQQVNFLAWLPSKIRQQYRITSTYLVNAFYFCHPDFGIAKFDVRTSQFTSVNTPGMPANPVALCSDNGALILVDKDNVYFSDVEDPEDFVPALGRAGFQNIKARVQGDAISVVSFGLGFMVLTTNGLLRGEFSGDVTVYRFRAINTEYKPLNSFCVAKFDNETVFILDERGLFQMRFDLPKPLTPLFNEYLIQLFQKEPFQRNKNTAQIQFDPQTNLVYLSLASHDTGNLFDRTYLFYPPLDKWGIMHHAHHGLGSIWAEEKQRISYTCPEGFLHYIDPSKLDAEIPFVPLAWEVFHPHKSRPGSCAGRLDTQPYKKELLASEGFYDFCELLTQKQTKAIHSKIVVGYARAQLELSQDSVMEITHVQVGSALSRRDKITSVAVVPPTNEQELLWFDFGVDAFTKHQFELIVTGTVDGSTVFVAEKATPAFSEAAGSTYFVCCVPGIWFTVTVEANEKTGFFHLKSLELTGVSAGRFI